MNAVVFGPVVCGALGFARADESCVHVGRPSVRRLPFCPRGKKREILGRDFILSSEEKRRKEFVKQFETTKGEEKEKILLRFNPARHGWRAGSRPWMERRRE